ncbi:MAG: hypothetical protein LBC68_09315 [Prevotellaceae bacterium]|jgi:bacteriocin-like protein|nr:hypothetical protein [Prevotellaceae bacterium]
MNKKFSKNDLMVIKGYETLTDNQLDEVKGGITFSLLDCTCTKNNINNGPGNCECTKGTNTNIYTGPTPSE